MTRPGDWGRVAGAALVLAAACGGEDDGGRTTPTPRDAPDRSDVGFVENLLTKVDDGEWTLGEGLVATLQLFAGEVEPAAVLRHPELLFYEGTGIVAMANEYLEDGTDDAAKAEITRLLDRLVLTPEELEAMAGLGSATMGLKSRIRAAQLADDNCADYYPDGRTGPGVEPCLQMRSTTVNGKEYRVFGPAPSLPSAGWTDRYYLLALEAASEIVPVYDQLRDTTPVIDMVFSSTVYGPQPIAKASAVPGPDSCVTTIYISLQHEADVDFKQILAHEFAHCFLRVAFPAQYDGPTSSAVRWWDEGMSQHLSNLVYPANNREWGSDPARTSFLTRLEESELDFGLVDRSYENNFFFQYLDNRAGENAALDFIGALAVSGGRAEQISQLAAYPGIQEIFHGYARALTDQTIVDTSGAVIPYPMTQTNRPSVTVGSDMELMEDLEPFGVSRFHLVAAEGRDAALMYTRRGQVRESSRRFEEMEWGGIPGRLPDNCSEIIVVATSTTPSTGYTLNFTDVRDAPALCLTGEWVVDNDSLNVRQVGFELDYVSGEIRGTFRDDGTVEVVYDDWEYRVTQTVTWRIGDVDIERYQEHTYTTDARGVTTYEVDGDRLRFGDSFELGFLDGTETIHILREDNPSGHIAGVEPEEMRTRPARGDNVFVTSPTYEVGGGTLSLFQADREIILRRAGFADEPGP